MRTVFLALVASLLPAAAVAKTNPVVEIAQEQNQWCWAGVTRSALLYFGVDKKQCELADWTRTHNTARDLDFGSASCCASPSTCNNWNYFWDSGGSIEELVQYFARADSVRHDLPGGSLTVSQLTAAVDAGKLFFIRWERSDGSGHFLLGHGYDGTLVHYMDPWPGEGIKVAEHAWMVSASAHRWTSSLVVAAETAQTGCSGKPEGTSCDDGDACTSGDRCTNGSCAGTQVSCTTTNPCMTGGTCNPATGQCSGGTRKADGASCDDGNLCTTSDRCQSGVCQGTARSCAGADACRQGGTCDPATGQCTGGTSKADGTSCDDEDACTTDDRCASGACRGTARTCAAIDDCHEAGACNPASGFCTTPRLADGTPCANGTCSAGACQSTTPSQPPPASAGCSTSGAMGLGWFALLLGLLGARRRTPARAGSCPRRE